MDIDEKIDAVKERFELSRASMMTQIFVTLATAHGVGMAAVLSMIGQLKSSPTLVFYLTTIVFLLGIGLFLILVSVLYRFEHSKVAEKEKIAKLTNDIKEQKSQSDKRKPLMRKYKVYMYASVSCLLIAIFVGMSGAMHNYFEQKSIECKSGPNKAAQADRLPFRCAPGQAAA